MTRAARGARQGQDGAGRRPVAGRDLLVVVLAAGEGKRMRSETPKVLHRLAGEPLLGYPVNLAHSLGARHVVVVHAPGQGAAVKAVCGDCTFAIQDEARGTGDALNQVPHSLRGAAEVLVLYGDVPLLTVASVRALLQLRRRRDLDLALVTARVPDPKGYGRVVSAPAGFRVVEEADATPEERAVDVINTGVCCFRAEALWPALRAGRRSSVTGEVYLTDLFARMPRRATLEVAAEEAVGVNDRSQLAEAERIVRRRINRGLALAGVTVVDPANTYIDAGVRIEADAVVEPFTFLRGQTVIGARTHVGPFAEIEDCQVGRDCVIGRSHLVGSTVEDGVAIGPFNRLRAGSVVARGARIGSYAEIKNSLVGPESDVHHFSYLGDAVLGKGVNIGAGTVTANYDGVRKSQTVIGDHVFIGSDSILVAPLKVGDDAYTAAGSVITRDVEPGSLAVERAEQRDVEGWVARKRRPRA